MQFDTRMQEMEDRAARLNLTMRQVLRGANVSYDSWLRWRKPGTSPIMRNFDQAMERLDKALTAHEADMFEYLKERVPDRPSLHQ